MPIDGTDSYVANPDRLTAENVLNSGGYIGHVSHMHTAVIPLPE